MRTTLAAFLLFFALTPALPAAAFDAASEARYQSLLAAAKAGGEPAVDWGVLRFAYADSAEFDLTGARTDAARKAMFNAVNAGDPKTALAQARIIIAQDYVDIDAHLVADLASRKLGDATASAREHDIVLGLLRSIHTSDGASPATALKVITVGEEYAAMRAFDMTVTSQALVQDAGHAYDRLSVTDPDGKPLTIYFLIDGIVAAEGAAVRPH
jgi:hypothetical protein